MKLRFQADADLKNAIVLGTRRRIPAIDFQAAHGILPSAMEDPAVLAEAARQGRVLVSHDVNTMIGHYKQFTKTATSPGLVVIPQDYPVGSAIDKLVLLWGLIEAGEFENRLCYLHSLYIGFP